MRHAYGKPQGTTARVAIGQVRLASYYKVDSEFQVSSCKLLFVSCMILLVRIAVANTLTPTVFPPSRDGTVFLLIFHTRVVAFVVLAPLLSLGSVSKCVRIFFLFFPIFSMAC